MSCLKLFKVSILILSRHDGVVGLVPDTEASIVSDVGNHTLLVERSLDPTPVRSASTSLFHQHLMGFSHSTYSQRQRLFLISMALQVSTLKAYRRRALRTWSSPLMPQVTLD